MSSLRTLPPKLKIYEALGAIADERVELDGIFTHQGRCASASTPGKIYTITYISDAHIITSNDSGSLNQGFLGYPAIAFLLKIWTLIYRPEVIIMLKGIDWKSIKQQVHKNHEETVRLLLGRLFQQGYEVDLLIAEVDQIFEQLKALGIRKI